MPWYHTNPSAAEMAAAFGVSVGEVRDHMASGASEWPPSWINRLHARRALFELETPWRRRTLANFQRWLASQVSAS